MAGLSGVLVFGWLRRPKSAPLKVGDKAPDFALRDQNGKTVRLGDFLGSKKVVLAFYVRAFTPGWRKELKAYQADIAKFADAGTQVIAISVDGQARNKKFAEALGAQFPILSDEGRTVSSHYDVLMPFIRLAKRTTFVVEKDGTIQRIESGSGALDPTGALEAAMRR
jgi:thioredoxin-dependent peroxiredoxin